MFHARKRKTEDPSSLLQGIQEFLDAAEAALVLISPDRTIRFMNNIAERAWGSSVGQPCFEVLRGVDGPCQDCPLEQVLESKELLRREMSMKVSGGATVERENLYVYAMGPVSGNPLLALVSMDSPGKRVLEREVRREKEISKALLESVNALVVGIDSEGEVSFVNRAAEQLTGLSESEIKAGGIGVLVPEEFGELAREYFSSPPDEPRAYEAVLIPVRNAEGRRRMISWTYSPLLVEDGQVEGAIALGQDVTERFARRRQAEKLAEELIVVNTILSKVGGSTDLDEMLEVALGSLLTLPGFRCGAAYRLEGGGAEGRRVAHKGFMKGEPPPMVRGEKGKFPGTAISAREIRMISPSSSEALPVLRQIAAVEGLNSVVAVPIFVRGRPVGLLVLGHDLVGDKALAGIDLLRGAADALELGAENALLRLRAEEQAKQATSLLTVAQSLTGTLDLTSALVKVAAEAADLLEVDRCDIWLYDELTGTLRATAGHDWTPADRQPEVVPISRDRAVEEAGKTLKPVIIEDAERDPRTSGAAAGRAGVKSSLVVPLITEGRFAGALTLDMTSRRRRFSRREADLMESFARQASIAIHNASLVEELRDSEERYRALSDNSMIATFVHDGKDVLYANDRAYEMIGYERGELNSVEEIIGLIVPEERQKVTRLVGSFLSGAKPADVRLELRARRKDGSIVVADMLSRNLSMEGRKAFMVTMTDITQRVLAEEALKSSEERYRTLVESSRDGIVIVGPDGDILFANSASVELAGLAPEQMVGTNIYSYVHPTERGEVIASFVREWEAGRSITRYPIRVPVKGEEKFFEATTVLLGEPGPSVNVMVILRDVTERENAQRLIRESEERYRTIVETSRDVIAMLNRAGEILYTNAAVSDIFGYDPEEITGRYMFEFIHPDDRERASRDFVNDWRTGSTIPNYPLRVIGRDGVERHVEASSGLVGWPDEQAVQIFIIRNVTDRKQRETERELQLRIDEAMAAIATRFVDPKDLVEAIGETLEGAGELLGLDRAIYIWITEENDMAERVIEWVREGVMPIRDHILGLRAEAFPWWAEMLRGRKEIAFGSTGSIPAEGGAELLQKLEVEATAVVPVQVRDRLAGAICFNCSGREHDWSPHELNLLREMARTISRAIERENWIERLGRSEEFRTRITESIGEGLFVVTDGMITWVNQQVYDIYGYTPEEMLGRSSEFLLYDPERLKTIGLAMLETLSRGEVFVTEEKARRADGRPIDTVVSITSLGIREDGAGEILAAVRDITESKQMQEAVSAAADAYSTLFSSAGDAFFVHTLDGEIKDVNERACQYSGYERAELLGKQIIELFPEQVRGLYGERREEVLRDSMTAFEVGLLRKDGGALPVEVTARLTWIWGEQVVLAAMRDVTERRKAEEETWRRARQLSSLNEIVKAATSSLDLDTVVEAILAAAAEASGADSGMILLESHPGRRDYRPAAALGETGGMREAMERGANQAFVAELIESLAGSEIHETSSSAGAGQLRKILGVLGEAGVVQVLLVPLRSGERVLGFMGLGSTLQATFDERDMGFYNAVGAEIGVAVENSLIYRELTAEHERLSLLYRTAQGISGELELDALLYRTAEEAARAVSARHAMIALADHGSSEFRWRASFNIDLSELEGTVLSQHGGIGSKVTESKRALLLNKGLDLEPAERDAVELAFGAAPGAAVPLVSGDKVLGVLMLHTQADSKRLSSEDVLLLEAIGRQAGVAIENARLYEQTRRHLEALEKAHQELKALDRMKSDFVSTVSHELRSPLAVIEGFAKTMVEHFEQIDRETERESLEIILKKSVALEGLIENILDMARIEEGRLEVSREEFELVELIERIRADQEAVDETHLVSFEALAPRILVRADREKTEVALGNLVRNAVKFSPEGGTIYIKTREHGGMAEVSVTDQGIGIPTQELDKIFDRFYQVESGETRSFQGSGLGLYITKELVQAMGGDISVESMPGHGSVFTFTLPLAR